MKLNYIPGVLFGGLGYYKLMGFVFGWGYLRQTPVGDAVIIKEDNLKPMHWKRGRIIELLSGKGGEGKLLQFTSPTGKIVYINRSVQKIIPTSDFNGENTDDISKTSERVDGDLNVAEVPMFEMRFVIKMKMKLYIIILVLFGLRL